MIKTEKKWGIEGDFLNLIKDIFNPRPSSTTLQVTSQLMVKDWKLSHEAHGRLTLSFLFNTVLEVLVKAVRKEKQIKGTWIRKEEVKLSLFTDNIILYIETSKEFTMKAKHLYEIINKFSDIAGYGGFPGHAVVKNLLANAADARDMGLIPGSERSPRVGNGNPFQYSYLGNFMDRGVATGSWRVRYGWVTEHAHTQRIQDKYKTSFVSVY